MAAALVIGYNSMPFAYTVFTLYVTGYNTMPLVNTILPLYNHSNTSLPSVKTGTLERYSKVKKSRNFKLQYRTRIIDKISSLMSRAYVFILFLLWTCHSLASSSETELWLYMHECLHFCLSRKANENWCYVSRQLLSNNWFGNFSFFI